MQKQIIRLQESIDGTYDEIVFNFTTAEICLIFFLIVAFTYIQLYTATIYVIIAILATATAIVEFCKQKYENDRW